MNKKKNQHLLLLIFLIGFFMNCTSEKPKIKAKVELPTATESTITKTDSFIKDPIEGDIDRENIEKQVEKNIIEKPKKEKEATPLPKEVVTPKKTKPKKIKPRIKKSAKIEFKELVWDFGEIKEGDIVEKKFTFTNTGDAPLNIIATSATCGCTRPSFPFLEIAPGESNVIGVTYNSVGKIGMQTPEVTIESNTIPKITTIKLKGYVEPKSKDEKSPILAKDTSKIDH